MRTKKFKAGFAAIFGRPNVGKSTLLNALVGSKISIISPIPQTTRYPIKGILNLENAQIVFVDTPGIHSFSDNLTRHLNTVAKQSLQGCDLILYLVDVSRKIGAEEKVVVNFLVKQKAKIIMLLNKIDLGEKFIHEYIELWQKESAAANNNPLAYYLPLSAKTGKNIALLQKVILENLPVQPPFYDLGALTDFPLKFRVADIVREQLFLNLKKELPHSIAVEVESIEEKKKVAVIRVNIYVSRTSQKKIIIGKKGSLLKEIGISSRRELEKIFSKAVYLDLWVKVLEDWQEKPRILQALGYGVA